MNDLEQYRTQARMQQEQAAAATAPAFIHACPGAGKTRVLVDRHCRTPAEARRSGRALLSFTNVAADELRERCATDGRTDLTAFPHYIGTLDSFLWRYTVRPFLPLAPQWKYLVSWEELPAARVGPRRIPLSSFTFSYKPDTGETTVDWPSAERHLHNSRQTKDDYLRMAARLRQHLWLQNGYMTGLETRIAALEHVSDIPCTDLLKQRFFEIVIDEAQDCSELDLAILARLHTAGTPLVIVADPDQGIYEWNQARPQDLHNLTQYFPNHLELNGNWRSSPLVCQLAATLRPAARGTPDTAVGGRPSQPVLLLPYGNHRSQVSELADSAEAAEAFLGWAAEEGIPGAACLTLAHRNTAIPKPRDRTDARLPKEHDAAALAWAAVTFAATDTAPIVRTHALTIATRFLCAHWFPEEHGSITEVLTNHDLTPALMRRRATQFLHQLLPVDDTPARQWRKQARTALQAQTPHASAEVQPASLLTLAKADLDTPMSSLIGWTEATGSSNSTASGLRSSSIHRAKGSEAEAVLIHLPKGKEIIQLLAAWMDPNTTTADSELLRVYYVAITRAQRLLSLTYPYAKHKEVTALLDTHQIPHRTQLSLPPA